MKITEITLDNGLVLRIGSHIEFKDEDWYMGKRIEKISDAYIDAFEIEEGDKIIIHAGFYIQPEDIIRVIKE